MNIRKLRRIIKLPFINIKGLAEFSNLNSNTLSTKVKRCTELKVNEADAIEQSFQKLISILNK